MLATAEIVAVCVAVLITCIAMPSWAFKAGQQRLIPPKDAPGRRVKTLRVKAAAKDGAAAVAEMEGLASEMNRRAKDMVPLLDCELDDVIVSLRNVTPESSGVDFGGVRRLMGEAAHVSHKDWQRTDRSARALHSLILPANSDAVGQEALGDDFRAMFRRILMEGNWDGAASAAFSRNDSDRPWAVLVTGVNGIRKTTSVYQPWFTQLLSQAIVAPPTSHRTIRDQELPTGHNSFFRQLDHMIVTLTNRHFRRLYDLTSRQLQSQPHQQTHPTSQTIAHYSNLKAAIFARYRTLSEMLGVVLVREAHKRNLNVLIETSGRDIAMFHYVDTFFDSNKYRKLALHFVVDDLTCAERSVDTRMITEIQNGVRAIHNNRMGDDTTTTANAQDIIQVNAGGPYGSDVLKGVQADSDRVWDEVVMNTHDNEDGIGSSWYKATVAISASQTEEWTAWAIRPDGTKGTVHTFERHSRTV